MYINLKIYLESLSNNEFKLDELQNSKILNIK
jgi:hypothetical protein